MKARISEIFDSIQGEGIYLGEKQIFVRFFGCNLSCSFCDTKINRFREYEPQQLLDQIKSYRGKYHSLSFTGGEPLLQKDFLKEFFKLASSQGHKNYLETNGTLAGELEYVIDYLDIIAMDLKLPSSTGMFGLWGMHRRFLKIASRKETFLKAIISHSTNEEDIKEALALIKDINKNTVLVLQPNSYEDQNLLQEKLEKFKDICSKETIAACIIPQIHKKFGMR
ncbi:MAG: 7-carboxy-7-deazaguanine synthase QueE [Candidatus Omnitrophica bacterium]|nr:7-carboxy-7-deazaguanine synthase QueE [Candidatus Omnitrophota bacterium]